MKVVTQLSLRKACLPKRPSALFAVIGFGSVNLSRMALPKPFLQVASVQEMLMPLAFGEKLTMLMPPSLFYRAAYRGRNTLGRARTRCAGRDGAARRYRH